MRRRFVRIALSLLVGVLLLPALALAQAAQASITGTVTDTSGGVLPGVTVEASSPALTERTRVVITDGAGQYRVVGLPPGTYGVTFTLPGFSVVQRTGIELSGSFNATVNVQLQVGGVEETITVTGETPIVDVQSARRQRVVEGEVLQAIPTSRSYDSVLSIMPSINSSGNGQIRLRPGMVLFSAYGGNAQDGRLTVDGINTGASRGGAGVSGYVPDMQNAAEVNLQMSGNLGEVETGGPQMQIIPQTGGNTFAGSFVATGLNDSMQGDNFDAELERVLSAPQKILKLWDIQGSVGGPIKRDTAWFFFNWREVGSAEAQPGIFANLNAGDPTKWTYEPDMSRQGLNEQARHIKSLRLTWQATPRNKVSVFWDEQPQCLGGGWTENVDACRSPAGQGWILGGSQSNGFFGPGPNAPETGDYTDKTQRVQQAKWQSPVTNRLLLEAGFGTYLSHWGYDERPGNPTRDLVRVQEQGGILPNLKYRSSNWVDGFIGAHTWNASASYVTGSHNVKVGYQGAFHRDTDNLFNIISNNQRLTYRFNDTVPNRITQQAGPWRREVRTEYYALYAQDQWTIDQLTLQGAVRFDHAWSFFPRQQIGPDRFIPDPIVFDRTDGVEGFSDVSIRTGAAYDVFGDGRTSVKVNFGRYMWPASNSGRYSATNPSQRIVTLTNRSWSDANGDYTPDCDLYNPAANGECGAWSNQNFGKAVPTTEYDPGILSGWGVRPDDWQFGLGVQHEVLPRVSVEVTYNRRWWHHYSDVTDNLLVGPEDYDSYSITAPVDPRLPGGGGYVIDNLWDIKPDKFGISQNRVTASDTFGDRIRYWHGVDVNFSARVQGGLVVQGGSSTGRLVNDTCDYIGKYDSPSTRFCRTVEPFKTQFRLLGTYTVPTVDVQLAATLRSDPGDDLSANLLVFNSQVQQSLGRPLAGGRALVVVNAIEPETVFEDRINQLDIRIGKIIRVGQTRTNVSLDIVNALNTNTVISYNSTFNANWPTPSQVLTARLFRIGVRFDF